MSKGKGKGSQFERDFCRQLSLWWTQDYPQPRDDFFWRADSSGARATQRSKAGQQTFGQYGDIQATHPDAVPFIDVFTVELKRGYNRATVTDLFDKPEGAALQTYEKWFQQIITGWQLAGSVSWLLIHKRDHRQPIAFFPALWKKYLTGIPVQFHWVGHDLCCLPWLWFLDNFVPQQIIELAKEH